VVRWRVNGSRRARRFKTEAEAIASDEGVSDGTGKTGSSTPNVYPYETSEGTRWRYSYRDSRGRLSTKRGFLTERAAARDREDRMGRVRQGTVVVSRMTFGEFFPGWLRRGRPYVTPGTWADYEVHGRKRLLPHFGHSRLTAFTTFEVSDWLLEFHEAGEYARKTLNERARRARGHPERGGGGSAPAAEPRGRCRAATARPPRARLAAPARESPVPRCLSARLPAARGAPHRLRNENQRGSCAALGRRRLPRRGRARLPIGEARYLRLSPRRPPTALVSLGVRSVSALPQTSASGTSRLRHSVGVWA
jgi:Phage integrase, N-terminal SAM-like domain